jgi:hypothetical protein
MQKLEITSMKDRISLRAFLVILFSCLLASPMKAQSANADLVKMVQAGLPEGTVVNKIHERAGQWDTSVDALIALKQAGATAAELDALTQAAAPATGPRPAPPPATIPAFGGLLGYTVNGVPYIQFPAGLILPTLTGEPSNRIFLKREGRKPLIVIPASFISMYFDIGLYGLGSKEVLNESHEGNILWSASEVRFEDLCALPQAGVIKVKGKKVQQDPGPIQADYFQHRRQIVDIYTPLGFREKKSLFYLGTLKNEKLTGEVFIVGVQGYTWPGRAEDKPAPAETRSPELQVFIDKLIQHPEETIAEFARLANLPADAVTWSPALDYVYNTADSARHYGSVNASYVAELKAKQPPSGSGFGSLMNVMQGVQNMASAQSMANAAAANRDMAGQLQAAMSAGQAEVQTLNAIGNSNAAPIQPLQPVLPNYTAQPNIQVATNQQLANIQARQAQAQQSAASKPQAIASTSGFHVAPPPSTPRLAIASSGTAQPPVPTTAVAPVAADTGPTLTVFCPASGFVPGVSRYRPGTIDELDPVACAPGSAIYVNGIPQFDVTCTNVKVWATGHPPSCPGSGTGQPGPGKAGYTTDPDAFPCFSVTSSGQTVTVSNSCPYQVHYYWVPYGQPNVARNDYVSPGGTDTFTPGGEYKIYACSASDHVVDPAGNVINHLVAGFQCVRQ